MNATPAVQVGWDAVLAWRMARQQLLTPATGGPVALARRLSGVHAQLRAAAELAMALRDATATPDRVRAALTGERTLVKTWAMRGTLHLLPAADLGLWTGVLSTRTNHTKGAWLRYHGVSAQDMTAILDAIPEALAGRQLTREELAGELVAVTGRPQLAEPLRQGWGALLKPAAAAGQLCFGPDQGRNVTFVSPRDWLGQPFQPADTSWALGEALRRYLDTYGPATREEFARWLALEPKPARLAFQVAAGELAEVEVAGRRAWMTTTGLEQLTATRAHQVVRLLGAFDPYVIGSLRQLEVLLPDASLVGQVSRRAGWISPVLVVGGRIAGTWRQERAGGRLRLRLTPFAALPAPVRDRAQECARQVAAVEELTAEVTWDPPLRD